jgi:serine/threonine protein kinase
MDAPTLNFGGGGGAAPLPLPFAREKPDESAAIMQYAEDTHALHLHLLQNRGESYIKIYSLQRNGRSYVIKFASMENESIHLIQLEYVFYKKLYALPDYETYRQYFLEGVNGKLGMHAAAGDEGEVYTTNKHEYIYVEFPFIESISLQEYITTPRPKRELCTILQQVCTALTFLLKNGLCHGDMHAGNVLIPTQGGQVDTTQTIKVIDFDSAGQCSGTLHQRLKEIGRGTLQNLNIYGLNSTVSPLTGFFVLCKHIFTVQGLPVDRIDRIIHEYKQGLPIKQAYAKMGSLLQSMIAQNGQGRRRKRTQKQKRRRRSLSASTKNRNK